MRAALAGFLTMVPLLLIVLLPSCTSREERLAEFLPPCLRAGFTEPQCGFLFAMKENADAAANNSAALAGVAVGLSGGRR